MDSRKRSIVKTLTWRLIAVSVTMIVVYSYNKNIQESIIVSFVANGIKMLLYYWHERVWNNLSFGRRVAVKKDI
ncbi:hypothetical protein AB834_04100 [PVC group bacterium (ex Bugula neritina AB1)]|nr:hypothetical protein AB834_04100 [PVC group bacterium (ex Bugula neritina AB1)]